MEQNLHKSDKYLRPDHTPARVQGASQEYVIAVNAVKRK